MTRMQKFFAGFGASVALTMGSLNVNAIDIPWDPDGLGPINRAGLGGALGDAPLGLLSGLDWAEGNALAVNSVPLAIGAQWTVHYQAKLSKFSLPGGVNETNFNKDGVLGAGSTATISGSTPTFEWTVNARFVERVVAIVGTTAFFEVVDDPSNYLKVFYDSTPDANNATGLGFTDGQEILSASIVIQDNSSFTQNGSGFLDSAPAAGSSVHGSGSFNIQARIDTWDDNFLKLSSIPLPPGGFVTTLQTSTLELPFGPADPAALLQQVGGPNVVPNTGTTNGVNGPDFLFEADGNQVFDFAAGVPEPTTAILGAMGLVGLAFRRQRKLA